MEEYLERPDSVDLYVSRAVQLFPKNPVLYIRKANRQYLKGDFHSTIKSFEQALDYADNDTLRGEIWGFLGDTYHQMAETQERRKRELENLKQIKQDSKKNTENNLSDEEKSHLDEMLDKVIASTPTIYPIHLSAKKTMKRCYEAYEKSLALHADNASVLNNYAYFLSEENRDLERALEMSSRAIHLDKNNATYLDSYAWILYLLGRYEEAQKYMRQALSLDRSGSPELPMHYGDILFAMGKTFMAETYWRKALEMGADQQSIAERLQKIKK